MKKSTYLSLGLFFLVAIWMLSGVLFKPSKSEISATNSVTHSTPRSPQKMTVGVEDIRSQNIMREIMVQGELEPLRKVEIRAQTTSRVVELPVEKGEPVAEGTLQIGRAHV